MNLRQSVAVASLFVAFTGVASEYAISNRLIRVELVEKTGAFAITDYRTGRTWLPYHGGNALGPAANVVVTNSELRFVVPMQKPDLTLQVCAAIDGDTPEFTVEFNTADKFTADLCYPHPQMPQTGDRLIVPYNEGMSFPVDESEPDGGKGGKGLPAFAGVLSMPFFGLEGQDGSGLMTIVETRFDAVLDFSRTPQEPRLLSARLLWKPQRGELGYARRIRFVALHRGGYVTMAKRYREWSKAHGMFKPLSEKAKERPNVDKLIGAVNFWFWNRDAKAAMKMIDTLDECGMKHVLWSNDAAPEVVTRLSKRPDTLTGRYDIYSDVYHPELMAAMGAPGKRGTNGEAWPNDILWTAPDSNHWGRAWSFKLKDGTLMPTARMCDLCAPKYVRQRISNDLNTKPFTSRFIDVTATSELRECYNPAHPMTRSENFKAAHQLLEVVNREFGLVTGSETGSDAYADICDYFEGTLSIGKYRIPNSGRDVEKICNAVPEKTEKYQLGEKYRIPLWELVYHDSVCAHWYWGDYQNKLPTLWAKRDLFNVLYGTMPMFIVTNVAQFVQDRAKFVRSYELTSPVARATGYSEMLDHRSLTADRSVQESRFSDGTIVTVNFGSAPFIMFDGFALAPGAHRVRNDSSFAISAKPVDNWERYVREFNRFDDELYTNAIPNAKAEEFLRANAPAFECADREIERAYHFRWWTYRKHIRSTPEGWVVTEFLPDVSWAGKYNTINCPAMHHFLEGRWLRDSKYLDDYARFWVTGPGTSSGKRAYVFGPAWSYWERAKVTGDRHFVEGLYDALVKKHAEWVTGWDTPCWGADKGKSIHMGGSHPNGMFATTDNYEGSEFSLSGNGYRPWINSAMWGEKATLAKLAAALGKSADAAKYAAEADELAAKIKSQLWSDDLQFFVTRSVDEKLATALELVGYSPWYYGMDVAEYDAAWFSLKRFVTPWGLAYPTLDSPGFTIAYEGHECLWNGPSWPYATSVALTALAKRLHHPPAKPASKRVVVNHTFAGLLHRYAASMKLRRDDGKVVSWIDENQNPFNGDWIARTRILTTERFRKNFKPERGKDYNHSTFCDLVIAGLVGIVPREDDQIEVKPLGKGLRWFRMSNVRYHGHDIVVQWDRTGKKYGESGLIVTVDGQRQRQP